MTRNAIVLPGVTGRISACRPDKLKNSYYSRQLGGHPGNYGCRRRQMKNLVGVGVVAVAMAFSGGAIAQQNVKVGGLFPLSGNAASAGQQAKAAVELAVDIVNGKYPDVTGMPAVGLPGLKGGKIELTFADHQGNPSTGQSQALRLIQQEKVSALIGAYQSSVTFAGTQVAERYGTPWVVGDSVASNITAGDGLSANAE